MNNRRIGLYNPKIETVESLNDCDIIVNNFNELKKQVKEGNQVVLVSGFSIYGYDILEVLNLIEDKKVLMYVLHKDKIVPDYIDARLQITLIMATNNYIRDCLNIIKKL